MMTFSCGWFLQPLDLLALFAFEADNSGGWGLCADMKLFFVQRFLSVSIYKLLLLFMLLRCIQSQI